MALPHGAMGCLQFVIVVFSDHTHLLFLATIKQKVDPCLRENWKFRDKLGEMDGFLLKGERLIVPKVMHKNVPKGIHKEMLDKIYNVSHLGVQKCLRRGQEIVFGRELMVKSGIKLLHVKSVMNSEISKQSNL